MRRNRRKRINRQKLEKRRSFRKKALIFLTAVVAVTAADLLYVNLMDGRFYHHTTLNGYSVSGMTAEEVVEYLKEPYNSLMLRIDEQGETVLQAPFDEIGYQVDEQALLKAVEDLIKRQSAFVYPGLLFGDRYGARVPFTVDEETFSSAVCADSLTKPRVTTTDATLVEQDGGFVIQPEVYGTDFEDSDLQALVKEAIDEQLSGGSADTTVTVEIPESIYRVPSVTQDDPDLADTLALYQRYCDAEITYTFGDVTEVLGWDTIRDWILPDSPDDPIDEEAIYNYVYALAGEYDTYGLPRTFESTNRGTMTIAYNNYGYEIDIEGEVAQLKADIAANTATTREPVYYHSGYNRNGKDDLNGTYVEVDLSNQYLWFYKHGGLVVESAIVSGLPTEDRATHEGVFTIPYKQSPANLVGQGGGPGESWDVEVEYWMPFDDGQGLHDATWQSSFGGNVYQYAGSHGCINLPLDVAAAIYYEMEEDVAILIYS
ncbi:hypothetical protein BRYFOR_05562 [Marvinbryantia formatexigens DSM 14469]|uniref:L,D-TPase catalytic domain-containing protein n=1 Tax=Marvinbryantia formatexigens DSM 14469 TaxID=478749 RepID=C6LAC0_9FIRM|nr:L,D-transpeptidase family protein [Marvinbryantia formatexigens]EET62527.1 hypothetical protein BRYFOR_05562 [Marvinbryantia formatexigens DSM 14469]UWO24948.1 L,D-transpeptidase/peptidoglycan binding protein [Marvinbryantia formatexigens DSM 14469]SDG24937.1 L,D-transpeptidase catalytic domain [Marvinbryantia formatexigens]